MTRKPDPWLAHKVILVVAVPLLGLSIRSGLCGGASIDRLRSDLASRLGLDVGQINLISESPVTWPDGALGLPRPGLFYTMALQQGSVAVLCCGAEQFFYTVGQSRYEFGGPITLWSYSVLASIRDLSDPNNHQCLIALSPVGTNPRILVKGFSSFKADEHGNILFVRQVGVGQRLYRLKMGDEGPEEIAAAKAFGQITVSQLGSWAIPYQTEQGTWYLRIIETSGQVCQVGLPGKALATRYKDGVFWIKVFRGQQIGWLKLLESDGQCWLQPTSGPAETQTGPLLLNKGRSLVLQPSQTEYKTEVLVNPWQGTRPASCLIDLKAIDCEVVQDYLFVWGPCKAGHMAVALIRIGANRGMVQFEIEGADQIDIVRIPSDVPQAIRKALSQIQ